MQPLLKFNILDFRPYEIRQCTTDYLQVQFQIQYKFYKL